MVFIGTDEKVVKVCMHCSVDQAVTLNFHGFEDFLQIFLFSYQPLIWK